MSLYRYRAVANGLRTDHPIPDLPFVEDSHVPVEDPAGIEAIGRHKGADTWGREDRVRDAGWVAFTTDQARRDLAWCVRCHPEHGRSVVVYRDEDAASVHMTWLGPALLFRSGGYWWDGTTWYRPAQIWDGAAEDYVRRPVPAAATVTTADLLNGNVSKDHARVLDISEVDPDASPPDRWIDHLALWADHRQGGVPLGSSVVKLTAPELTGDQLVGVTELADMAGVAASTLRAYIARGEGDVPLPQATIGRSSVWARPVAEEWVEQRRRSSGGVEASVSINRADKPVPAGVSDIWEWFTRSFFNRISGPQWRKRFALRWRTDTAIRELARQLGWDVAASLNHIIPLTDLATTLRQAVLFELGDYYRDNPMRSSEDPADVYSLIPATARMLDWLIRHDPAGAQHAIGEIVGTAERKLEVPRELSEKCIRLSIDLDGKLDPDAQEDFFDRVLIPTNG